MVLVGKEPLKTTQFKPLAVALSLDLSLDEVAQSPIQLDPEHFQ